MSFSFLMDTLRQRERKGGGEKKKIFYFLYYANFMTITNNFMYDAVEIKKTILLIFIPYDNFINGVIIFSLILSKNMQ